MKRIVTITLPTLLLAFVLALGIAMLSSNAAEKKQKNEDVVILICLANYGQNPPTFEVQVSNSSANAPSIARGTPGAQALADLFVQGFEIEDVQPTISGVIYTLAR